MFRIPVIVELSEDGVEELRRLLAVRPAGGLDTTSPHPQASPKIELPLSWRLVEERHGVVYTWGEDHDVYDPFRVYEGEISSGRVRLAIGKCERARTFGEDRIYYIVASIGPAGGIRAVSEFLATDDYDETGDVIAIIKGKEGSARQFDRADELPAVYASWPTATYRDRVDYPGAYSKQALVCNELEHEGMLNHALAQIQLRGLDT